MLLSPVTQASLRKPIRNEHYCCGARKVLLSRGCSPGSARLKESRPRPNQPARSSSAATRWWLPLAADVMMATGVVCCASSSTQAVQTCSTKVQTPPTLATPWFAALPHCGRDADRPLCLMRHCRWCWLTAGLPESLIATVRSLGRQEPCAPKP